MKKLFFNIQQYNTSMDFSKVNNMPIIVLLSIFLATGGFNLTLDYILKEPKKVPNKFNNYWFQFQYFNKNVENHWYSKNNINNINILLYEQSNGEVVNKYTKKYLQAYSDYILTIERISQNINKLQKISTFMFDDISPICCPNDASEEEIIALVSKLPSKQRELLLDFIKHFNKISDNSKLLNENLSKIKKQLPLMKNEYANTLKEIAAINASDINENEKAIKSISLETKMVKLVGKIKFDKKYGVKALEKSILTPLNTISNTFDESMITFNSFHKNYTSYIKEKTETNNILKFIYTSLFGVFFFMLFVIFSFKKKTYKDNLNEIKDKTKHFRY